MLPADVSVVGIDEHTALAIDLADGTAQVMGAGDVTVWRRAETRCFTQGDRFSLAEFGPFAWPRPDAGLPAAVWAEALAAAVADEAPSPPAEVLALVAQREAARAQHDWAAADALRARIQALGWQVQDTPKGPRCTPMT
ncbi:MAG: CysS/YqeB C-terminal domain-containing protein [Anaerolineae bacterium]